MGRYKKSKAVKDRVNNPFHLFYFCTWIFWLTQLSFLSHFIEMTKECIIQFKIYMGLPRWLSGKQLACQCKTHGFNPWSRQIPRRRKCQPIPAFLPGKSREQRSLVGYSPWVKKSWTRLSMHAHMGKFTLLIYIDPQPFWHQRWVSWKVSFP